MLPSCLFGPALCHDLFSIIMHSDICGRIVGIVGQVPLCTTVCMHQCALV